MPVLCFLLTYEGDVCLFEHYKSVRNIILSQEKGRRVFMNLTDNLHFAELGGSFGVGHE